MTHEPSRLPAPVSVAPDSIWTRSTSLPEFAPLHEDLSCDALVIGGGITGLGVARRLAAAGQRVVVVERRRLGSGTTSASTAHLTLALDEPWDAIAKRFGATTARGVADSVRAAIDVVETEAHRAGAGCGFARVPGFRVAETARDVAQLEREADAARELGLAAVRLRQIPGPLRARLALRFEDQAELDPRAFLAGRVRSFVEEGGRLFEESPVVAVDDAGATLASGARVRARVIVHATHTPVASAASIQGRLSAYLSYVVALRLRCPLPPGLFWDCDSPYHYLRSVGPDRRLVLVGGEDRRVGADDDPSERYAALEAWARARVEADRVEARWCGELFEPSDGLPFIGELPGTRNQLVAAGFSGTGVTFGTVAALVLSDLVLRGTSAWERVYRPSRIGPFAGIASALRENLENGWHFFRDGFRQPGRDALSDLGIDAGRVVRIDGRPCAAYRDLEGGLHLLSARCTHRGCTVQWNDLEKTWDCPCHGGRFHRTGKVLYGPPPKDLPRLERAPRDADSRRT